MNNLINTENTENKEHIPAEVLEENPIKNDLDTQFAGHDDVNHPHHYRQIPSGIETIEITEHFNFNLGNALKYIIRSNHKGQLRKDLEKARWYIDRELERVDRYGK